MCFRFYAERVVRHFLYRLVFSLFCASCSFAVEATPATASENDTVIERGAEPAWVTPLTWEIPANRPTTGAGGECILSDGQDRLTPQGSDYYYHLVVRLLNANGVRENAEQSVNYAPEYEHVTWHTLKVYRDGQVLDRLPTTKFRRLQRELGFEEKIYTGLVTAAAVLDDIRVGDILEFSYTYHSDNPILRGHMSARHLIGAQYPIARQVFEVRTPADQPAPAWFFFVPPGTSGLPGEMFRHASLHAALDDVVVRNGERVYHWEAKSLPPIVFDERIPGIAAPYYPLVRCDSFMSWSDVAAWAEPLFATAGKLPNSALALTQQWKTQFSTPLDRVAAAMHWVQDDVRYFALAMGDHNLRPRPLPEICSSRFGDCKDKSVLLSALLRAMDIEAWPALVSTYWRERVKEYGPGAYAFNHVIVAYRLDGKLHWIDATLKDQKGALGEWAVPPYGLALILRPDESDLTPVPELDLREPDTTTTDRFTVDAQTGDAILDTEVLISGLQADLYRQQSESSLPEQTASRWFNFIVRFYKQLGEIEPPQVKDDPATNQLRLHARYRIPHFVQSDNGTPYVETYAYALRAVLDPIESRRRHWSYALPADRHLRHRIEVKLPFVAAIQQQPVVISADGFEYRAEKGAAGENFTAVHDVFFRADYIDAARMNMFGDAVDEALHVMGSSVRRVSPKSDGAGATSPRTAASK